MTKIVHDNGVIELIAADGMEITDGNAYSKRLLVGLHGDESKWYEITEEEAEERRRETEEQGEELTDDEALDILLGGGEA